MSGCCPARPMSELGQTEKNSGSANVFSVTPESGHPSIRSALRICAKISLMQRRKHDFMYAGLAKCRYDFSSSSQQWIPGQMDHRPRLKVIGDVANLTAERHLPLISSGLVAYSGGQFIKFRQKLMKDGRFIAFSESSNKVNSRLLTSKSTTNNCRWKKV
jgi:hypothetical protein